MCRLSNPFITINTSSTAVGIVLFPCLFQLLLQFQPPPPFPLSLLLLLLLLRILDYAQYFTSLCCWW